MHDAIGIGVSDYLGLALAVLLAVLVLALIPVEPIARKLARRTRWCMLFLAGLAIALRLTLLPTHPVPTPKGADDFSYLLLADTLAHFRLANPPHAMHRFFETTFVLQQPAYSSIYTVAPALALALGQVVFHLPWAGVVLSVAAFCSLCYWMLRGWTTPGWALAGGLLAVCEFGPLSYWMNSYWGGAVSAAAGCLVFGALPRLRERGRIRDAILLGLGVGVQMLSRPYESIILDLAVVLFFLGMLFGRDAKKNGASEKTGGPLPLVTAPSGGLATGQPPVDGRLPSRTGGSGAEQGFRPTRQFEKFAKIAAVAALAVLPAVALLAFHNHAVTGNWTTLPYMLSRYQYGVPTTFTFQPDPVPHARLTAAQQLYYEGQSAAHDATPGFYGRLFSRVPFTRFFLLPPLYLVLPFFLLLVREFRFAWVAVTLLLFALGSNFYPYFFPHYVAAAACLVVLAAVAGLEQLSRVNDVAARWIVILCGAHFLFWYGVNALGNESILSAMAEYDTWDVISHGDPEHRIAIGAQLAHAPGKQLVFVRYGAGHGYHEWIHNAADIDGARVVMALDLGPDEDEKLERYYPDRAVWLLEPDALPPRLTRYKAQEETPPATDAAPK